MPTNNESISFKFGTENKCASETDQNAVCLATDTHKIYVGGVDYTSDQTMNDATKQYVDNMVSIANSRVDNIIANNNPTEGNSELIDIRIGADRTVYRSAGDAVREQLKNLDDLLSDVLGKETYVSRNILSIPDDVYSYSNAAGNISVTAVNNVFSIGGSFVENANFGGTTGVAIISNFTVNETGDYCLTAYSDDDYVVDNTAGFIVRVYNKDTNTPMNNVNIAQSRSHSRVYSFETGVNYEIQIASNSTNANPVCRAFESFTFRLQVEKGSISTAWDNPNINIEYGTRIVEIENDAAYNSERINSLEGITGTIVCWGDSLTAGAGNQNERPEGISDGSYPAQLQAFLPGFNVVNGGIGGETSWMIAARQGGESISAAPFTMPAAAESVRIYLLGEEQNIYHNGTAYVYSDNALSYNINTEKEQSLINPCYIDGIGGTLSRTLVNAGNPDPDTGETAASSTYAYYFTRSTAGSAKTYITPVQIMTSGYKNYRNAVNIIWAGQNDKVNNITQYNAYQRIKNMTEILPHKKYIVMSRATGNNSSMTELTASFMLEFGNHYLNIREWLCKYGVSYANSLGANLTVSEEDQALIDAGCVPSCLRSDGVHGNYWYYACVAKAVYDKGKGLGYW